MGNYLTNVAAKGLERTGALRPRIPSLFEPPAALLGTRLTAAPRLRAGPEIRGVSEDDTAVVTSRFNVRDRMQETDASLHNEGRTSARKQAEMEDGPHKRLPFPSFKGTAPVAELPVLMNSTVSVPAALPQPLRTKPRVTVRPQPKSDREDLEVVETTKEVKSSKPPRRHMRPSERELSSDTKLRDGQNADNAAKDKWPQQASRHITSPQPSQTSASPDRPTAIVPVWTEARPKTEEEAADPNINVVIGRVVVQAVLPPAPPLRAAPSLSAPMLSLEQYLKQRGGY